MLLIFEAGTIHKTIVEMRYISVSKMIDWNSL